MGLSIIFGLSMLMSYLTYQDLESFIVYLTIFSGFGVWSGLIPLFVLVLCIIILVVIVANNLKKKRMI